MPVPIAADAYATSFGVLSPDSFCFSHLCNLWFISYLRFPGLSGMPGLDRQRQARTRPVHTAHLASADSAIRHDLPCRRPRAL